MILASDNWTGASDKISAALAEANKGAVPAYGGDDITARVEKRFCEVFERDVAVFLVTTGTAANALAISHFTTPGGVMFSHENAHVRQAEAGAVSFFGGGKAMVGVDGVGGKLVADDLSEALEPYRDRGMHGGIPVALSLSQLTEWGQAYRPSEITPLADVAHEPGMIVHMDGARFAGAAAATGLAPADLTWRAGVDVMSFGGTKNGCVAAEAVVFFNRDQAKGFDYVRVRAGQGLSKNWFVAAQFEAYLGGDHWLELARHANAAGQHLAGIIDASDRSELVLRPDANQLFVDVGESTETRLHEAGIRFHRWRVVTSDASERIVTLRLVTSFQTRTEDLDLFETVLNA